MRRRYCSCCVVCWFIYVMVLAMMIAEWKGSDGCLESERIGLRNLQSLFRNYNYRSWGAESSSDECCDWEGVGCDMGTGRVISLDSYGFTPLVVGSREYLYVNASLFLPFQQLTTLSLSYIRMVGWLENTQGFTKLSPLANLEHLDLSGNSINNSVLSSLSALSSLKHLQLGANVLTTQLQGFEVIPRLVNLESLDLSDNDLGNGILSFLSEMTSLKSLKLSNVGLKGTIDIRGLNAMMELEEIDISGNDVVLKGLTAFSNLKTLRITTRSLYELESLSAVSSLKFLRFSYSNLSQGWPAKFMALETLTIIDSNVHADLLNNIGSTMNNLKSLVITNSSLQSTISEGLCNLKNLQMLSMWGDNLFGELPQCLSNLTLLRHFVITENELWGDISQSPLTKLFSLEGIDISLNGFQIPLSLSPFFNHSRLRYFMGRQNQVISGDDDHPWQHHTRLWPRFQLTRLHLSSRNDDGGGGYVVAPLPKFLYHQRNLLEVSIRNTKMRAPVFPWWLLNNNTNLIVVRLINCSLQASFQLHDDYLLHHQKLTELILSDNKLTGILPYQLSNCSSLEYLDVSNNHLFGEIPRRIWNMSYLAVLDLSKNNFSGDVTPDFISPWINEVYLSNNHLEGDLSLHHTAISNGNHLLSVLDLSHNRFTGNIPIWIGGFPRLTYILLSNNNFSGQVEIDLCLKQLKLIDISHNYLSGHLSSAFGSDSSCSDAVVDITPRGGLEFISKTHLYTYQRRPLDLIRGMDFSSNNFIGEIPPQIGLEFTEINVLNISYNKLSGPIPSTLSSLKQIESLDLSHNNLSGIIPLQLTQLNALSSFSVAFNNLSGKCPEMVAQFSTFDLSTSYGGNPFLRCTFPVQSREPMSPISPGGHNDDDDDQGGFIDMEAFYGSSGVTCVMVLLILAGVLYINPYWRQVWFYYVEVTGTSCYYFVVDNLPLPARYKMWELRI